MTTNLHTAQAVVNSGRFGGIHAAFVQETAITLEGDATTFVSVSLQARHSWPHGIFENSRYLRFVLRDGSVQCIAKHHSLPTFRKTKAATSDDVVAKVNRYLDRLSDAEA
jgi:hypothetical protein